MKIMKFSGIVSSLRKAKERWGEDPDEIIHDALEAGYDDDFEEALDILEKGIYLFDTKLDDKETKSTLWEMKAVALYELKKYDESLKAIDMAIKFDKKNPSFWADKVDILHELEKYDEALDAVKQGSKYAPKDVKIEFIGMQAHLLGHFEKRTEALKLHNKYLMKYPDDIDTWFDKSDDLASLEKYKESLEACEEGLKIKPDDSDLLGQKGYILLNLNKNEEAISYFDKAILIDPKDDFLWYNKACALSVLNRKEEALDALTVATALDPESIIDIKKDKDFDKFRNHERFIRITKQSI